jgi:arylsulfatase A-like enzyme/Flp pilus assembly protein TadD
VRAGCAPWPAALALLLSGCGGGRSDNLVLITLDTTRADHIGAYGYAAARTPVIDALAAQGFLFRRHLTPVPTTLPAHTSLMSGLFPPVHTVRDNGTFIVPENVTTLAEVLRDEGFDTSAFIGSFPLDSTSGLDQGFEHYDDELEPQVPSEFVPGMKLFFDERPAAEVVDAAIAYHRARRAGRFFTFLHFFDAHQPQEPPPPYDVEFRQQPYDGEIAYIDEQIGRFIAFLEESGDWDRTLVVLTADHGEGLGDHGELTHSMLLHQATLHIPLILRGPGVPLGQTDAWTASTQVFATALELLGIDPPATSHAVGRSLVPLLENGGETPRGWPRFEAYFETIAPRTSNGWAQLTGWMKGDWRLVHGPKPELYDLATDPQELDNRFAAEPETADGLFKELASFLDANESVSAGESFRQADAATVQRLEALGYLNSNAAEMAQLDDMLDVAGLPNPRDHVFDIGLVSEAKAAMMRGHWDRARSLYEELLQRTPDSWMGQQGLAILYGQIEEWDLAFSHLDRAIEVGGEHGDMELLKGELLVQKGAAEAGLEVLLGLEQSDASFDQFVWTGRACSLLGRHLEAQQWFRRALEIEPEHRWARLYLANALAASGTGLEEAEVLYQALIAEYPYFNYAYYNYGKMLLDLGQLRPARRVLERAAVLSPGHELTQRALETTTALEAAAHAP